LSFFLRSSAEASGIPTCPNSFASQQNFAFKKPSDKHILTSAQLENIKGVFSTQ
jgi:hypothetical protein